MNKPTAQCFQQSSLGSKLVSTSLRIICFSLICTNLVIAQERWFQIEVSVFTNESSLDRLEENWQPERTRLSFPNSIRKLDDIADILLIDQFMPAPATELIDDLNIDDGLTTAEVAEPSREEMILQLIQDTKPQARKQGRPFKFVDPARNAFLKLPSSESDFSQTNRTLDRDSNHRLLWHSVWRQPVLGQDQAKPIYVAGGELKGSRHELEGSIVIRFNDNADRVVLDANLWLLEQSLMGDAQQSTQLAPPLWNLPKPMDSSFYNKSQLLQNLKQASEQAFRIDRVYHMTQSRAMRSNEFHYLDHPALGIVVMVKPYEVPPVVSEAPSLPQVEPSLPQ